MSGNRCTTEDEYMFVLKLREADYDLAYELYGEEWQKHIDNSNFFSSTLTEKEKRLLHETYSRKKA